MTDGAAWFDGEVVDEVTVVKEINTNGSMKCVIWLLWLVETARWPPAIKKK